MKGIKGCTHYATKVVGKFKDGGVVAEPKVMKTRTMPSGAQQYVRGNSKRVVTSGAAVEAQKNAVDTLTKKGYGPEYKSKSNIARSLGAAYSDEVDADNRARGDKGRR